MYPEEVEPNTPSAEARWRIYIYVYLYSLSIYIYIYTKQAPAVFDKISTFKKYDNLETQGHPNARVDFTILSKRPYGKARRIPRPRTI